MRHVAAFLALPTLVIAGSALAGSDDLTMHYTTITDYAFLGAPTNGQPNSGTGSWGSGGQFYSNGYNTPAANYATSMFYGSSLTGDYTYGGDRMTLYAYRNLNSVPASTGAFVATFTLSQAVQVMSMQQIDSIAISIDNASVAVGSVLAAGVHQIRFDVNYVSELEESSIVWDAAPVPAPGAAALIGLAGLAGRRRRR